MNTVEYAPMNFLSPHFSYEEFTLSETAMRKGIDNTPPAEILTRLKSTAGNLELVRAAVLFPLHITSGYRAPALNAAIGGVPTSAHCKGWAVDFVCPRFGSPFEVANAIREKFLYDKALKFDQLILEYGWVHISFDPLMRNECLTKKSAAAPYVAGLVA